MTEFFDGTQVDDQILRDEAPSLFKYVELALLGTMAMAREELEVSFLPDVAALLAVAVSHATGRPLEELHQAVDEVDPAEIRDALLELRAVGDDDEAPQLGPDL